MASNAPLLYVAYPGGLGNDVAVGADIVLIFDVPVEPGVGSITIRDDAGRLLFEESIGSSRITSSTAAAAVTNCMATTATTS